MGLFKKLNWRFIKGAHGYGHEIIQVSNEGGKRVAILDCQDSVKEEYETGYSIVPTNHVVLEDEFLPNPDDENRFSDEELRMNGQLIANAPEMWCLLSEIYHSSILFGVDERNEAMDYKIHKLIDKIGIRLSDMIDAENIMYYNKGYGDGKRQESVQHE